MNHNCTHKGMFTSSPARRVGWVGLIAMLACSGLYPVSAQNTNTAQKAPPRQKQKQQIEAEKETEVESVAMAKVLQPGTLRGKINFFVVKGGYNPNTPSYVGAGDLVKGGCFHGDQDYVTHVALAGFLVKGKDGKKGNATVHATCSYEFKDVQAGTYKLQAFVSHEGVCGYGWVGCYPDTFYTVRNYYRFVPSYIPVARQLCVPDPNDTRISRDPLCVGVKEITVTIQAGKTTTLDLSVLDEVWK